MFQEIISADQSHSWCARASWIPIFGSTGVQLYLYPVLGDQKITYNKKSTQKAGQFLKPVERVDYFFFLHRSISRHEFQAKRNIRHIVKNQKTDTGKSGARISKTKKSQVLKHSWSFLLNRNLGVTDATHMFQIYELLIWEKEVLSTLKQTDSPSSPAGRNICHMIYKSYKVCFNN